MKVHCSFKVQELIAALSSLKAVLASALPRSASIRATQDGMFQGSAITSATLLPCLLFTVLGGAGGFPVDIQTVEPLGGTVMEGGSTGWSGPLFMRLL